MNRILDGWQCQKCGKRLFAHEAHCTHVLPKDAGLLPRWDRHNTILLYFEDHIERAHRHPIEFRDWFQAKLPDRFIHLQQDRPQCARLDEQTRRTLIAILERELARWGDCP